MAIRRLSSFSRLELLPDELKQTILAHVSDTSSLASAILSCRSLYSAFISVENSITAQVLHRHIGPAVLPDAIARYESLSIESLDYNAVQAFITKQYSRQKSPESQRWTLRAALKIAKFHRPILRYTEVFVLETGSSFPCQDFSPSQQKIPITSSEVFRVQRTFYRYEVFCNIFRIQGHSGVEPFAEDFEAMWIQDRFLSEFAPWENEQLACAYQFIVRKVSPIYDDFVEHDIMSAHQKADWGAHRITETSGWFEFLLTLGLERLWQLFQTETYAQRRKIMSPLAWREQFLRKALQRINGFMHSKYTCKSDMIGDCETPLRDFTPEEEGTYIGPPFYNDPDPGPARVWRWVNWRCTPFDFVDCESRKPQRAWGYVMWDIARLERAPGFHEEFKLPDMYQLQHESTECEIQTARHLGKMEKSLKTRQDIYDKGGRGWWSKDDESHVVWTGQVTRKRVERPSRMRIKGVTASEEPRRTMFG